MANRRERIQDIIDKGDVAEIARAYPGACACVGNFDGEPLCRCEMTRRQISQQVSLFALKRGRLVRLKRDEREHNSVASMTAVTSKSLCEVILKELHRQRDSGPSFPFVQDFDGDFRCVQIDGDIDLIALAEAIERERD